MRETTFHTSAFLSNFNCEYPTLELKGNIPKEYTQIVVSYYDSDEVVIPDGFDEKGRPYFSHEFYEKIKKEFDRVVKFDKERARNLWWFDVTFKNAKF